jgi:phospholipase/carboxylesterase
VFHRHAFTPAKDPRGLAQSARLERGLPVRKVVVRTLLFMVALTAAAMSSCAATHTPTEWDPPEGGVVVRQGRVLDIDYLEVVPEGFEEVSAALPMLVFIHGRGDRPRIPRERFMGLDEPVRLIIPRAPKTYGRGFTWLPVSARSGESPALVDAIRDTSAHLANAVEALVDRHPTLGSPIVMGFSQGGMLTFALAVHHPEVVGAAFPLAGWLPPSLMPSEQRAQGRYPAIRALHGEDDRILPVERTEVSAADLEELGFEVELVTFEDIPHEMSHDMWQRLEKWVAHEVRQRLIAGERTRGPNA